MTEHNDGIILQSAANLVSRLIILASSIIFYSVSYRYLSKHEVAILSIFEFLPPLLDLIPNLGFQANLRKLLIAKKSENFIEAQLLVQINTYLIQFFFVIISLIAIFFSKHIAILVLKDKSFSREMILIIIWGIIFTTSDRMLATKQALGDYYYVSYFNLFRYVTSRAAGLVAIILGYRIHGVILAHVICFLISIFFISSSTKIYLVPIVLYKYPERIVNIIKYSLPFYWQNWARYLCSYVDQPMVAALFKPEILSIYFIIRKFIFSIIILIIDSIREPVIPRMIQLVSSQNENAFLYLYYKSTTFLNLFALTGLMSISIFPREILTLYAGKEYVSNYIYLILFGVYLYAFHIFNNINTAVFVLKAPKWYFYSFGASGLVNLLLSFLFGFIWGIKWFIIGQSLGFILVGAILLLKYKVINLKMSNVIPLSTISILTIAFSFFLKSKNISLRIAGFILLVFLLFCFYKNDIVLYIKYFFMRKKQNLA